MSMFTLAFVALALHVMRRETGAVFPSRVKWGGHDGLAFRAQWPPGPSSLRELFQWPSRTADGLTAQELHRLEQLMQDGVYVYGDYSGIDTYRECIEVSFKVIAKRMANNRAESGSDPTKLDNCRFTFARACDYAPVQQA
jgi:hypothetical protein